MTCRFLALLGIWAATSAWAVDPPAPHERHDLFLGEAFYHAQTGDFFDAITRMDNELYQFRRLDEPTLDPFHLNAGLAEFSVGDFELSYRMHQRAGRALNAILNGNVSQDLRNEAAFRLARVYMEKGEKENALHALEKVKGKVPERIRHEEQLLRAQVYIVNGRFTDAIPLLEDLRGVPGFEGYAAYNLGIALVGGGKEREGLQQLDKAGQLQSQDEAALAIRDKANLVLGYRLLEGKNPEEARQYLDRVRLTGPFSDRALLGSGWSDVSQERFDRALVPWSLLAKRNATNKAVQESLLGVPYAYAKLNLHGRAALLYGSALEAFGAELVRLKSSVESIRGGQFLTALTREEIKQDSNWVVRLRELPDAPETYYLMDLMASNDFQSSLKNYLDLNDLRRRIVQWKLQLDAFDDMIALRRAYYEPLLPGIDARFRELDSQIRLRMEQRQTIAGRLQHLLVAPDPELLVTSDERLQRMTLAKSEPAQDPLLAERLARMKGLIHWNVQTTYDQRLTDAWQNMHDLEADIARLKTIYAAYVRTRQAATQSYTGYDTQISQARTRIAAAEETVTRLMSAQGRMLESMAITELEQRRSRLEQYQVQARFAMAESYDRAVKAQQQGTEAGKP